MIYFISDLHLGHKGIISMQNRPFESVDEMNRILIRNYNTYVNKEDTAYLLGGICHHVTIEAANEIIASLNGKKYLIKGNHDKKYDERLKNSQYIFGKDYFKKQLERIRNIRSSERRLYKKITWTTNNTGIKTVNE